MGDILKKKKRNRSLSETLLFSFLSLSLAILLISGSIGIFFVYQAEQKVVSYNQQLIAQNAANKVTGFIQQKLSALKTTARLVNPTTTSQKEQVRILNYFMGPHTDFRQLVLLNAQKQKLVVVSRVSQEESSKLYKRFSDVLFAQVSQDNIYISPVYVDDVSKEPMTIIAVSVRDFFGNYQAALIADVNLKFMWNLVESMKIGRTGLAYVVDSQGKLIAFGDICRVLSGENIGNLEVLHEFMKNPVQKTKAKAILFKGINGTRVVGMYTSLGLPDWAIVTELPVSEAYEVVIRTTLFIVILSIFIGILAGWTGIYLAQRLSSPIAKLMETAVMIAGGKIELQAEVGGATEISNLAEAFNCMTAQLREIIEKLEQRDRYLQKTVQKYVAYMEGVGKGKLDSSLELEDQKGEENDPLIILGCQLNDTTVNLKQMIEQIQDAAIKIKRNEESLKVYSGKLKKSNDELEQFAYIASHDLKEPLRKIKFFGNQLKANYSGFLDEKAVDYIDRMNNAITRMETFINDLLQYSRVSTKAKPFESVDMNVVVKEVLSDLEIKIDETKAVITLENLPTIDADPLQMRQLFQNIIGNAIKYHRPDVSPAIKIDCQIINEAENNYCEIGISDNGIGFDNKYIEQIFGLFQRLHGRSEYEGTGIGLAICKKIVEQHGGVIKASSKEGEGSKFSIKLPLKQHIII